MTAKEYIARPIVVHAIRIGDTDDEYHVQALEEFAGSGNVEVLKKGEYQEDLDAPVSVWNYQMEVWQPANVGDWVLQGEFGEFYVVSDESFDRYYEG